MKPAILLAALLDFALAASAAPTVYPHDLEPATYPDYTRRLQQVPDWETFHHQPQFVGVRYTAGDENYFTERWQEYQRSH
jgi:hypothetical protein